MLQRHARLIVIALALVIAAASIGGTVEQSRSDQGKPAAMMIKIDGMWNCQWQNQQNCLLMQQYMTTGSLKPVSTPAKTTTKTTPAPAPKAAPKPAPKTTARR